MGIIPNLMGRRGWFVIYEQLRERHYCIVSCIVYVLCIVLCIVSCIVLCLYGGGGAGSVGRLVG